MTKLEDSQSVPPVHEQSILEIYKSKNVLVTGGAGFVGSNLSTRLIELGATVTVLDDLSTGDTLILPKKIHRFVEGSVTDKALVSQLVAQSDFVFHLAVRNIILSTTQVYEDFQVNIGGTVNVLMAARASTPIPRVVYTSSASVYGNPRSLPISEDSGINILSPYAASKLAGENYANAFNEMFRVPVTSVRYSNIYGTNQSPSNPYCGVVSKFFESSLNGEPMRIHGSGLQTRDFTYVEDAVEATLLAGVVTRAEGGIFNVGSGFETSIRDLAVAVGNAAGREPTVEFVDRRDIDNVQRRVVNIERARRVLRWLPKHTLESGLALTRKWIEST